MLQKFQNLWKDLKNFLVCKYYRFQGTLSYPHSIIPKPLFRERINFGELLSRQIVYILRRSDKLKGETFNELGYLREDIIFRKDVPNMSMNLMGTFFKEQYLRFVPEMGTKATENWDGKSKVYLSEFINKYKTITNCSAIYFEAADLHNIDIPYSKPHDKEAEKLFKTLKHQIVDNIIIANSKTVLEHSPTYLNYWHIELSLLDFNSDPVKKIKNNFHKDSAGYFLLHVLSIKALPNLKSPLTPIKKSFYKLI